MNAFRLFIAAFFLMVAAAAAAPMPVDVAADLVARLVGTRDTEVRVIFQEEGTLESKDSFTADRALRVTALVPDRGDNGGATRVAKFTFRWDDQYEWFIARTMEEGSLFLRVFSSKEGELIIDARSTKKVP